MNPLTALTTTASATMAASNSGVSAAANSSLPFSALYHDAVDAVSGLQETAEQAASQLIAGAGVDVHQAVIAAEKANMAFEMALAVRNKAVQAYQQVMSMQF